jgi:hypothetical protein
MDRNSRATNFLFLAQITHSRHNCYGAEVVLHHPAPLSYQYKGRPTGSLIWIGSSTGLCDTADTV